MHRRSWRWKGIFTVWEDKWFIQTFFLLILHQNESKGNSFASKRILRHDEFISYGLEEYYKCLKLHEIAIHVFFPLC